MPIVPKKKRTRNYDKYFRHGKRFSRSTTRKLLEFRQAPDVPIDSCHIRHITTPFTEYKVFVITFLKTSSLLGKTLILYCAWSALRLPEVIEGNRVITATTLRKICLQRQDQSTDSM